MPELKKKLGTTLEFIQWALIIFFYIYFSSQASAQSVAVEGFIQQSVIGVQKGYAVKFVGNKGFGYGVFHQSTDNFSFETESNNYPFTGVEFEVPFATCGRLQVTGAVKGGFVNEYFLVLVPEINTKISFGRFVVFGLGAGYRAGQTALAAKLIFKTHR